MKMNFKTLLLMLFTVGISSACSENSVINEAPVKVPDSNTEINASDNTNDSTKTTSNQTVLFEDDFNQTSKTPNTSKWALCTRYIGDPYISQSYDQAYVENGKLILKAEKVGGVYKSGGVWTQNLFDFTYGKVEVSARFKTAQGGWPAIWLLSYPLDNVNWELDGEIDIMEQYNNEKYFYSTVHSYYTGTLKQYEPIRMVTTKYNVGEFNTYAVEWTPEQIKFSVNGKTTLTYNNLHLSDESTKRQWAYKKPFYLILNYSLNPGVTITDSELPGQMEVDWVKITRAE